MLHSQWRGHMREVSDGVLGKNKVFSSLGFPMFSLLIAPPQLFYMLLILRHYRATVLSVCTKITEHSQYLNNLPLAITMGE